MDALLTRRPAGGREVVDRAGRRREPPLKVRDFVKAIKGSRPTVSGDDLTKNADWTKEFGSEGA